MNSLFSWFSDVLREEYELLRVLKENERSQVWLIRHKVSGGRFVLCRFTGNAEVYRRLLGYVFPDLPRTLEVAVRGGGESGAGGVCGGRYAGLSAPGALFSRDETRKIVAQLCQAPWVLHSMDAVHRDVKPENVILRGSDAVLIDFDAARFYKPEAEGDTQILGTTGFAAPEQYGLRQSDTRADIYSMGVLINVMLTGEHPSRRLAPGRMGRIVERCTQVNPEKRYKDIKRLMAAL